MRGDVAMDFSGTDIVVLGVEEPHSRAVAFLRDVLAVWPDLEGEIEDLRRPGSAHSFAADCLPAASQISENTLVTMAKCRESFAAISGEAKVDPTEEHVLLFLRRQENKWEVTLVISDDPENAPHQQILKLFLSRFRDYECVWPPSGVG